MAHFRKGVFLLTVFVQSLLMAGEQTHKLQSQIGSTSVTSADGTIGARSAAYTDQPGIYADGEFLFWNGEQEGLEYAVAYDTPSPATATTYLNVQTRNLQFSWGPGFRIGIGSTLARDQWDLFLNWTRFQRTSTSRTLAAAGTSIGAVWSPFGNATGNTATTATASWDLKYNTADLEFGRHFFISRKLSARPFIALRGAWIMQGMDFNYYNVAAASPITNVLCNFTNNYQAGGLRAGLNLGWHFTRYFGLFGSGGGSLLYGRFKIRQKIYGDTASNSLVQETQGITLSRGALEAAIGLFIEFPFCKDQYRFMVRAAYELIQWFNQNQLYDFVSTSAAPPYKHRGDLGLQGGTFAVRLDF